MAGVRWPPEDSDLPPPRPTASAAAVAAAVDQLVSDDERSVAADSWSIKSEYGSTLDDEQRHADAAEILSGCNFPAASDYRFPLSLSFSPFSGIFWGVGTGEAEQVSVGFSCALLRHASSLGSIRESCCCAERFDLGFSLECYDL